MRRHQPAAQTARRKLSACRQLKYYFNYIDIFIEEVFEKSTPYHGLVQNGKSVSGTLFERAFYKAFAIVKVLLEVSACRHFLRACIQGYQT
jgi:hypothetical protein